MYIATALNEKYVKYTYVMLTSLFENNTFEPITVFLLHSDLTSQSISSFDSLAKSYGNEIKYLKINRSDFPAQLPVTSDWSLETYFRLKLIDAIPPFVDRLLYLDVDMIIDKSLEALYNTDFSGNNFIACKDMTVNFPLPQSDIRQTLFKMHFENEFTYFNAGMMLWNLESLRKTYSFDTYMQVMAELHYQVLAPDQDLLNYMHWNQIKFVDEYRYDLFARFAYNHGVTYEDVKRETAIIHFAGYKPWDGSYVHYEIEQLWWEYAQKTPYYHTLLEDFVFTCISNTAVNETIRQLISEKEQLSEELQKSSALCQKLYTLVSHNK